MALPKKIERSIKRQEGRLLETGQRFNRFDQIRQRHFWSTHLFKPDPTTGYISAGTYQLFTTPPGQSGQGYITPLTELETNWKAANRVPDNQNIELQELGVSMWSVPAVPQDTVDLEGDEIPSSRWMLDSPSASSFAANTVLSITYLTNQVELGMVSDFAQASAPYMGTYQPVLLPGGNTAPQRGIIQRQAFSSNGFPGPALRRRLKIPILLQHGETFSFTFTIPRPIFVLPVERATATIPNPEPPALARYVAARLDFFATESFVEKS